MTTKPILLAAAFFGLVSCGQQQKDSTKISSVNTDGNNKLTFTATELTDKIEFSFINRKADSLEKIFIEWNSTIMPNSDDFIHQNDTINSLYNVYKEFYKPLDLLKLGNWEGGNDLNSKCKYVVIQHKIFYSVLLTEDLDDFDWKKSKRDSIVSFRPPVSIDKSKVLYLTNEYADALNKFLGIESTELGEENSMNPSRPEGEREKRYAFLRPYIPVLHGHWGGYWHLETHPDISVVIFNKTLTKAKIIFRVGYQGGASMLEKKVNTWTIKESNATWIE